MKVVSYPSEKARGSVGLKITSSKMPLPPGPTGHWLLGNLRDYRRDRLGFLETVRDAHGPVARYRLGTRDFVVISEPRLIEQVLVTRNHEFGKSAITKMLASVFGNGLLLSEGEFWLRQRRLIQPTFAQQQIARFGETMVRHAQKLIENWRPDREVDLLVAMQEVTMTIAAETLLGVQLAEEVQEIHEPHDFIRADFDRRTESIVTLPQWVPTPYRLRVRAAQRKIGTIVDRLIDSRRSSSAASSDILSKLLALRDEGNRRMTDTQVRDEALTFLFAGHETTASTLAWVWYLLATHPEAEAQLHKELSEVLAGRLPTAADVPRLGYTTNVVCEALRLFPSVYGMSRQALADCELGGYRIPQGTNLVLSQWLTHRDAQWFSEPLEFHPNRWAPEFQKSLPHYAYFPFGGGPRVCIGNTFAMMEAVLVIATMASRYRFQLVEGHQIRPHASVTLRPSPGVRAICYSRQ